MKTKIRTAAIAAAALGLMFTAIAPAQASGGAAIIGSQAYWNTSTDQLSATDTDNDGKSAIAQWRSGPGGRVYETVNSGGNGTTTYVNVPNAASGQVRACVQDLSAGGSRTCGSWINRS